MRNATQIRNALAAALALAAATAAADGPRLRIGWQPSGIAGSNATYELRIISADAPSVEPDTMSLDVTWPQTLALASEPTSAIPAAIAKDYEFFADPISGLPAGTVGRRISVFRSGSATRNFTTGDGIATFAFAVPATPQVVTLAGDPAGGAFNGSTPLDGSTTYDPLTVPPDTATPTPTVTPTATPFPFTLEQVLDSLLRRIGTGADANSDGSTDAADAVTALRAQ
jgi:hypothetical protein